MPSRNDRKYTTTHEWILNDGTKMGITPHLAAQLGTATNVDSLPLTVATSTPGQDVGQLKGTLNGNATSVVIHSPGGGHMDRHDWLNDGLPASDITANPYDNYLYQLSAGADANTPGLMTAAEYDAYLARISVGG